MVDITEGIVGAGELSRGLDWGLGGSGRGLDEARLVDLVIGGQQRIVTVGVGGAEGLQVIRQLASSQTCHTQGDDEGQLESVCLSLNKDKDRVMLPSREAPNNCYLLYCCLESMLPIYRWLGASLDYDPDLRRLPRRSASFHNTKEEEVLIID